MPDEVLVDTNVLSFIFKRSPDAERYLPHLDGKLVVVSFMTIAELDRWAIQNNWGSRRREQMEESLRQYVVHPYTRALTRRWAELMVAASQTGVTLSHADGWIAATALLHDIPLITDNARDFRTIPGLKLVHEPRGDPPASAGQPNSRGE